MVTKYQTVNAQARAARGSLWQRLKVYPTAITSPARVANEVTTGTAASDLYSGHSGSRFSPIGQTRSLK